MIDDNENNVNYEDYNQQAPGPYTKEELSTAKSLCIASVLLYAAPYMIMTLLSFLLRFRILPANSYTGFGYIASTIRIAAIIVLIVCRAKYPEYQPAKVLMWIYIILFVSAIVIGIIALAVLIYTCNAIFSNMSCG